MDRQITVLEQIIEDVATDLYNKWSMALPEEEKNETTYKALAENSKEVTIFIVKNFMDRFNAAAEELKDK